MGRIKEVVIGGILDAISKLNQQPPIETLPDCPCRCNRQNQEYQMVP